MAPVEALSTRGRKAMGPGRGLPTLTYKAHWRHWSPSRGVWPRWLFSAAAAQRGGRRVSHTSRATPAAVPVQLGQSQRPSVSKGYRVSTRCSAVLRRLGFHSQEEKEFRLLQNARHPQGKKGGTMSSVERRDWLLGHSQTNTGSGALTLNLGLF